MLSQRMRAVLGVGLIIAAFGVLPATLGLRPAWQGGLHGLRIDRVLPEAITSRQPGEPQAGKHGTTPAYVFFGYISCSTVCPATLGSLRQLRDRFQPGEVRFIFVSIDATNDTPARREAYRATLGRDFYVRVISGKAIRDIETALQVRFLPTDERAVDFRHPAKVALITAAGRAVLLYEQAESSERMWNDFQLLRPKLIGNSP